MRHSVSPVIVQSRLRQRQARVGDPNQNVVRVVCIIVRCITILTDQWTVSNRGECLCRLLDTKQFALLLPVKNAQRMLAVQDPGQCLN